MSAPVGRAALGSVGARDGYRPGSHALSAEDEAIMARFVRDYLELLDHRVDSIAHHLESGGFLTAHVALLSLESTSFMVGAPDLADAAKRLRLAVEEGDRGRAGELLAAVRGEADRARAMLHPHRAD